MQNLHSIMWVSRRRQRCTDGIALTNHTVCSFVRTRLQVSLENAKRAYPVNEVTASTMQCVPFTRLM